MKPAPDPDPLAGFANLPSDHHTRAYSLDELHDDLDRLIHEFSVTHPADMAALNRPRRCWLRDMSDLTDDLL